MDTLTASRDLVAELSRVEGKAEIINGEIVHFPMTGKMPGYAGDEILVSLHRHAKTLKTGRAVGDGKGFLVNLPFRRSFSPDVAYYVGSLSGMKFYDGAPIFAVEVRSEGDHGPAAARAMAAKRADYFAAGTLVVWDVDLQGEEVVRAFRDHNAEQPAATYRRDQIAEAEPAVPGWTMPVNDLFAAA